eukprot:13706226-Ditylum_brightwellii.AAC.1
MKKEGEGEPDEVKDGICTCVLVVEGLVKFVQEVNNDGVYLVQKQDTISYQCCRILKQGDGVSDSIKGRWKVDPGTEGTPLSPVDG